MYSSRHILEQKKKFYPTWCFQVWVHFNRLDRSSFHQWPKINDSAGGTRTWEMQPAMIVAATSWVHVQHVDAIVFYITFVQSLWWRCARTSNCCFRVQISKANCWRVDVEGTMFHWYFTWDKGVKMFYMLCGMYEYIWDKSRGANKCNEVTARAKCASRWLWIRCIRILKLWS